MDKYPCGSSEIEKVEVRVQVCERGEKGEIVNRSRRTFVLDPTQYNLSEMQQYEREHGAAGEAVEHHKIGKPFLVLSGTVVGGQNDVIVEPPHHCLDVGVEKVANLVTIYFLWQGPAGLDRGNQQPDGDSDHPDVIPTIDELIKCVKADPITSNCTEELLERHRRIGALEIRKLLMRYGTEEGWRRARQLFSRPVQCMTRLNRELTDDEMGILKEALGYEFDRAGYPLGGRRVDHLRSGDGGGGRRLPEGEGREDPDLGEE
jgi:hypothetical protein